MQKKIRILIFFNPRIVFGAHFGQFENPLSDFKPPLVKAAKSQEVRTTVISFILLKMNLPSDTTPTFKKKDSMINYINLVFLYY